MVKKNIVCDENASRCRQMTQTVRGEDWAEISGKAWRGTLNFAPLGAFPVVTA